MLKLLDLDDDQNKAIGAMYENDETLLVAPTGSGKTVCALTAINELGCAGELNKVLIIAPLKVCDLVWRNECAEWEHLRDLKVGIAIESDRDKVFKRLDRFDVVVINFEIMQWMADNDMFKHFDGIMIDEITKLSGGGAWFKSIRRFIKHFKWRVAMSAVPVTEAFTQLFYIQFFVDAGKALGRNRDTHLRKFFYPEDFKQRKWLPFPGKEEELVALIEPTLHVMPNYKDTLPPVRVAVLAVEMPVAAMRTYKEMAATMSAEGITATSTAGMIGKCQQIANGYLYSADETVEIHHAKFDVLDNLIMQAGGESMVIVYQHDEERRRLEEYYPGMEFLGRKPGPVQDRWNKGEIHLMGMHIRTGSHGLNLQHGGHNMVLLSPVWSQDQMTQVVDRLWRRGQKHPVDVAMLVSTGTVDELIIERLNGKAELHVLFLEHVEAIRAEAAQTAIILPFGVTRH